MSDWIAWFMLAAATFAVVSIRLRPLGKNSARGQLGIAGFMLLSFRPGELPGTRKDP